MKNPLNKPVLITLIAFVLFGCGDDYFKDTCGCKTEWKEKLAKSPLSNDGTTYKVNNMGNDHDYISNNTKVWDNVEADKFISSLGGKKYLLGSNPPGYEIELGNDIVRLYSDESAYSTDHTIHFEWRFENGELKFLREEKGNVFNIGKITLNSGKPVFYESEENKAERGVLEDKLPSKVLDFCACKCEYTAKGFSDAIANDSCDKFLIQKQENAWMEPFTEPWGDVKEVLERN